MSIFMRVVLCYKSYKGAKDHKQRATYRTPPRGAVEHKAAKSEFIHLFKTQMHCHDMQSDNKGESSGMLMRLT